jgi:CHAD domain-containing protein/CYTH domain-containing protein
MSLLGDDAHRAVRVVALGLLARVRDARARLGRPGDPAALHDFRVAVRRLRSWLTVQAPMLGHAAPPKAHRWLRRLAQATNPSRDDEVFAGWLAAERATLAPRQRGAADWLAQRIARHRKRAEAALSTEIDRDLDRAVTLLEERLPLYDVPHHVERGSLATPFASEMAALVLAHTARLRRRLLAIRSADDAAAVHHARIVGKQLRYLMEPVAALVNDGAAAVAGLKQLQDLLGDHHDARVWLGSVREATPRAPRAALRTGLQCITAHIEQRATERFATLEREWLAADPPLFAVLGRVAASLAAEGARGVEIERKYLLRRMPRELPRARVQEIEQGYLPGERLIERVRRVRTGRRVRHFRTVKGGTGLARLEIEEECSAALFARLWPLTKGRRVTKRRHLVRHEELEWAIDEFTDRKLVLAEVELPSRDAEVVLPPWLAPVVRREVTGEAAYVNAVLARSKSVPRLTKA